MNESSGSLNSEVINNTNTPQTQKNKDEGPLEFNGIQPEFRHAATVQKKDKNDDEENDIESI